MSRLYEELINLNKSDEYPLHMPGHKRQPVGADILDQAHRIDITEIEGFDNLYDAQGILRDSMDYAAKLYGCPDTYYLVNGSTVGILTAILAASASADRGKNDRILIASDCHRSVTAGAELAGLDKDVIKPGMIPGFNICGGIKPYDVSQKLDEADRSGYKYAAVAVTSPTYEGVISDIEAIAKICHDHDTILIVDEAHGAHLALNDGFPAGAIECGADITVHSTHKTLAAMTQTALLHVRSDLVDITIVEKYLSMLQTSSPSYVLMSSIDEALHHITEHPELVEEFVLRTDRFRTDMSGLKNLKLLTLPKDLGLSYDPCKIVITTEKAGITGFVLQSILLRDYDIQIEMAAEDHIVAIVTYMDTEEGFGRLKNALLETDDRIPAGYYNDYDGINEQSLNKSRSEKKHLYAPCIPSGE